MQKTFPSHLDLAHAYWKDHVQKGDWAIDATIGNGHDTLFLAELVGETGRVIGLDIQKQAIEATRHKVQEKSYDHVSLYEQSHDSFPLETFTHPISLIVYNLGYLPGGDKEVTTQSETTLQSVGAALEIIQVGGIVSVTCYPGHPEGEKEERALTAWLQTLSPRSLAVCHHRWINRKQAPSLLIIKKLFV